VLALTSVGVSSRKKPLVPIVRSCGGISKGGAGVARGSLDTKMGGAGKDKRPEGENLKRKGSRSGRKDRA